MPVSTCSQTICTYPTEEEPLSNAITTHHVDIQSSSTDLDTTPVMKPAAEISAPSSRRSFVNGGKNFIYHDAKESFSNTATPVKANNNAGATVVRNFNEKFYTPKNSTLRFRKSLQPVTETSPRSPLTAISGLNSPLKMEQGRMQQVSARVCGCFASKC